MTSSTISLPNLILEDYKYPRKHQLYCKGGSYLFHQNGKWTVKNVPSMELLEVCRYDQVARAIITLTPDNIPEEALIPFIKKFNTQWTSACFLTNNKERRIISPKGLKTVSFNSFTKFRWLSNFFRTIIYDMEHQLVYASVESGYVSFKAREGDYPEKIITKTAKMFDPKKVKQKGKDYWSRDTRQDNIKAAREMFRLLKLKFIQNPILLTLLEKTRGMPLVENTASEYWGQQNGVGKNTLGRLLMKLRDEESHLNSNSNQQLSNGNRKQPGKKPK